MGRAPEPGVHATHRGPHDEPRVVYAEPVHQEAKLRFDHVDVTVTGKLRVHPVARLARFAVADSIRQDDEKLRGIERLARAEKFAREFWPDELRAAARRPVRDQHRISHDAFLIL